MERDRHHQALLRSGTALRVATIPTLSPREGGVLIAPSFVGVCGTDLQILNGTRPDTAEILGHEGSGTIVESGPGASLRAGQHITFNPSAQMPKGKILGHNVPGLFQQYVLVDAEAIDDGVIQPMEETDLPPICGALVEPVGGVIYAHELITNVVPDFNSAVIFGAGPIGLILGTYLRQRGVRVLTIHSNQNRLNTASHLGALDLDSTLVFSPDCAERILAWNDGNPLDAALICTPMAAAPLALGHAVETVRNGGCIELVSNFPASARTPAGVTATAIRSIRAANICGVPSRGEYIFTEIAGRRLALTSHRGTSRAHLNQAQKVLKANPDPYTSLITHILSLQEATTAVETMALSRETAISGKDCIKAVIDLTHVAPFSTQ